VAGEHLAGGSRKDCPMQLTVDPDAYTMQDLRKTVSAVGRLWDWTAAGFPAEPLTSFYEEICDAVRRLDPSCEATTLAALGKAAAQSPAAQDRDRLTATVARTMTALHEAGRVLAPLRPTATGTVHQLNISDGGVPKRPVTATEVSWRGLAGDRQRARQHHGRPWQALSLWSLEVIESLRALGHPVTPGAAGENVTVAGVAWELMRGGVQVQLGQAVCEIVAPAMPCSNIESCFADGDWDHVNHERGPVSRVYAAVVQTGAIAVGDVVAVLP
jgi:MOSC domain-containing protein YiiM